MRRKPRRIIWICGGIVLISFIIYCTLIIFGKAISRTCNGSIVFIKYVIQQNKDYIKKRIEADLNVSEEKAEEILNDALEQENKKEERVDLKIPN